MSKSLCNEVLLSLPYLIFIKKC